MKFSFAENDSIEIEGLVHIANVARLTSRLDVQHQMWRTMCQEHEDRMFTGEDYTLRGKVVRVHGVPTCMFCVAGRLNRR